MTGISSAFDEQADYEKGFAAYYSQHISPCLDKLEADRQENFRQFSLVGAIGGGAVIAIFALLFFSGTLFHDPALAHSIDRFAIAFSKHGNSVEEGKVKILFGAVFAASVWPGMIYKRYGAEAKAVLLPPLLRFFGDLNYDPVNNIPANRFVPFDIMPHYNSYKSEDHIAGKLDDVSFSLAELDLVEGSGKNRHTVFRGIAIILQMNKPFEGKTIVKNHAGWLSAHIGGNKTGMENVTLEDITFGKQFDVYSTNQVEARYLLTTAFMERLMQLATLMQHWGDNPARINTAAPSHNLSCSFYTDSLLLMVPCSKEMFQPGTLFQSAYNIDDLRCVLHQVYLIRGIIETLKLDRRAGAVPAQAGVTAQMPPVMPVPPPAAQPADAKPQENPAVHHPPPADQW